ncbi:MAG: fibronectin type III domain-containing protein [bacterium]|nr:fibronectin type III domain-containing protein [bacterium]
MLKKLSITILVLAFTLCCGKKGPLKLEPELLPKQPESFTMLQVGQNLRLMWTFPKMLSDDKTELDITKVRRIDVKYSPKEILHGKFRKKSKLLRKLTTADIKRYEDPLLTYRLSKLSAYEQEKRRRLTYIADIPFKLEDLAGKAHFVTIRYFYGKKKSPYTRVAFLHTMAPVHPVSDLKITKENKLLMLQWSKPETDMTGNPVANIAGYKIFRKVVRDKQAPTSETSENAEEPAQEIAEVFTLRNLNPVLTEYFEDKDTGRDGRYHYYISTVLSKVIESAPSEPVAVDVTDLYAPDPPRNVVSFRASDHMFLTWKPVPDSDFSHYKVYRRIGENEDEPFTLIAESVTDTQFKDKSLRRNTLYFYTVTAVDKRGNESEYSNIVNERF